MCCMTHDDRDQLDASKGVVFTLAEHPNVQCQCKFGNACGRRATQEDGLCDWCRGTDHYLACDDMYRKLGLTGRIGSAVPW